MYHSILDRHTPELRDAVTLCQQLEEGHIHKGEAQWAKINVHSTYINPISYGLSDSVAPTGGGRLRGPPPIDIEEGVIYTPCCYIPFVCLYI